MSTSEVNSVQSKVMSIRELPIDDMVIPEYQRPYKWSVGNINQLINDIITFRKKSRYRLGTLVLFKNDMGRYEIVDGQQRIVSLVLLLKKMYECLDEKVKNSYLKIEQKVDNFASQTKFHNKYSLHNVVENTLAIENRKNDFDYELYEFVLSKCEFVVVVLNDISEAFQFFDSQNARGKDLEAHDLLKAYHLREITTLSEADSANINEWQKIPTNELKTIFLTLFRAKSWSKGKSARYFTKNDIGVFKGVSINGGKR